MCGDKLVETPFPGPLPQECYMIMKDAIIPLALTNRDRDKVQMTMSRMISGLLCVMVAVKPHSVLAQNNHVAPWSRLVHTYELERERGGKMELHRE